MQAISVTLVEVRVSLAPAGRIVAEPEVAAGNVDEHRIGADIAAVVVEVSRTVCRDSTLHAGVRDANRRLCTIATAVCGDLHTRVAPENRVLHDDLARIGDANAALVPDEVVRLVAVYRAAVERRRAAALGEGRAAAGPGIVAGEETVLDRNLSAIGRVETACEGRGRIAVVLEHAVPDGGVRKAVNATAVLVSGIRRRTVSEDKSVDHTARSVFRDEQAVPGMAAFYNRDGVLMRKERELFGKRQVFGVRAACDNDPVAGRRRINRRLYRPLRGKCRQPRIAVRSMSSVHEPRRRRHCRRDTKHSRHEKGDSLIHRVFSFCHCPPSGKRIRITISCRNTWNADF